jgi:exopolyphosphatase/guanosine-5'-triphosphate,3'-diphosphate pyrophosphatase
MVDESSEKVEAGLEGEGAYLAAVDLGSNSFHMVVARETSGQPIMLDRLRERVALAEGLGEDGSLADNVADRSLACLERFGQRIADIPEDRVRAVATATLREMRHSRSFLARAEAALGHEIEVLPGREEARLIYLGVAQQRGADAGQRLVVDIGGASTECILGRRFEAFRTDSLSLGCVSWSRRFFPKGELSRKAFDQAELAARIEFETLETDYREEGWEECIGSSGTILAVAEILERQDWSEVGITPRGLARFRKACIAAEYEGKLSLDGLKDDRRPVIAGGLAILSAAFEALNIECMRTSKGALREGLLYDLLGRIHHEDVRERSVRAFAARYNVDEEQAQRVAHTALALADGVLLSWDLDEEARQNLVWAAALHEVGLVVSYSGYHRHGAYLIAHSDMAGFSRDDQRLLAALVSMQRGKLSSESLAADLSPPRARLGLRLAVLLRLAVWLHRSRRDSIAPVPVLSEADGGLRLTFPEGWLDAHPLTRADFELQGTALAAAGFRLESV